MQFLNELNRSSRMKELKKDLEHKLEKIVHVYIFAQKAYLYTEYFHNPETSEERELITNPPMSHDLSLLMHLMFRTLIIEVSKLFSRSKQDNFQLEKFINSLSSSGHFRKISVSEDRIIHWKERLKKNKKIIDIIILLRDRLYAHTDNPMINYNEIDISFKQIKTLLDLAAEILKSTYADVFETDFLCDSPGFDRNRFMILK